MIAVPTSVGYGASFGGLAALLGMLCLLGGQLILDRVFGFGASLSIIIELVGGSVFLLVILKKGRL